MTKADEKILSYLTPSTDKQLLTYGNDTYFCGISKHLKNDWYLLLWSLFNGNGD